MPNALISNNRCTVHLLFDMIRNGLTTTHKLWIPGFKFSSFDGRPWRFEEGIAGAIGIGMDLVLCRRAVAGLMLLFDVTLAGALKVE